MSNENGSNILRLSALTADTGAAGIKRRRVDIDMIRIIACFLVLFNHTLGYQKFGHVDSLQKAGIYSVFSIVTVIHVPLFYMITGSMLFTDKQESYKQIFKKRVVKVVVPLSVLTVMLAGIGAFRGYISTYSVDVCFRMILKGADEVGGMPYWFLYRYLGILLLLPFYRRLVNNMRRQDFRMLIILYFFFNPFMSIFGDILSNHGISPFAIHDDLKIGLRLALDDSNFFPLIGYYLDHNVDLSKISRKKMYLLFASGMLGVGVTCYYKIREMEPYGVFFSENYLPLFKPLTAICVFMLIKYICYRQGQFENHEKFAHAVTLIGSLTYGIYLFDPFMKWVVYSRFVALISSDSYLLYPNIIYCLLSMFVGGGMTWWLKKIPVIKKLF